MEPDLSHQLNLTTGRAVVKVHVVNGVGLSLYSAGRKACRYCIVFSTQGKPRVTAISACGPARILTASSAQIVCFKGICRHALGVLRLRGSLDDATDRTCTSMSATLSAQLDCCTLLIAKRLLCFGSTYAVGQSEALPSRGRLARHSYIAVRQPLASRGTAN